MTQEQTIIVLIIAVVIGVGWFIRATRKKQKRKMNSDSIGGPIFKDDKKNLD